MINTSVSPITCTKIESPVANCMVHTSATVCGTCDMSYFKVDDKTCKAYPTDCLSYSHTKCDSCAAGFIKNMNLYRLNLDKFETSAQKDAWWSILR